MVRSRVPIVVAALALLPFVPASAPAAGITREPVTFTVRNPLNPLRTYTIQGVLIRPTAGCTRSVLLAMHGLSYGKWAWDFPLRPETYSVAQALAARGYAMVTIDRLGYGDSYGTGLPGHPNGYTLTVQGYGEMTAQIAKRLRAGTYGAANPQPFAHVGLIGHSAGSEAVELAAGVHPKIADVLIATAYTHEPFVNNVWLAREWSRDNIRAAQHDYEYFETNPTIRANDMHNVANTDADVLALDNQLANLTPSSEIFSIGSQPSRWVIGTIAIPTLLVLADHDALFPAQFGPDEMLLFAGSSDKTLLVAPNNGHSFMLERNAQVTDSAIADWLDARNAVFPKC
jgi:pimeloyl-ACP methyl ester carboxylesterase